MGAFKKLENRIIYLDMDLIHVPSFHVRQMQKAAMAKYRLLKKTDPFARCMGAKRVYQTAEELQAACDDYFKVHTHFVYDKQGQPIVNPISGEYITQTDPLTVSGLARHLGIATNTLRSYKYLAGAGLVSWEFSNVVIDALQRIEEYAESRIYDKDGHRGSQFVLQATFNWATPAERSKIKSDKAGIEIAREKLKMSKEEHTLKMQMLQAGIGVDDDKDINITITRASRSSED